MAKKTKQGKNRKDKFYNLAKDQGYRARSAFKLIQLAKKFDFLSKAQVCLDLCAAPGGWSQVAQQNMPSGSTIIAVDLVPIKPIHGVTCIQSDITSDKCRSLLKRELLGKRADVVLNDVAPNVGANWARDAYVQNELVLQAMKLACEHLRPGGIFVTKVFRSADYNSLTWVFNQLFGKVEATKPVSSRNVSAEIFVLCKGFKAGRIDPRFFDPKWVFMDPEALDPLTDPAPAASGKPLSLADHLRAQKKRHRSGYEPGDDLKICAAHDFVASGAPAEILVTHHRIDLAATGSESLLEHLSTTEEIKELCGDLKVLGKKDLTTLLKWRAKILRERERAERAALKAQNGKAVAVISSSASAAPGESKAAADAKRDAGSKDVDEAIAQLLDDDAAGGKAKAEGEAKAAEEEDEVDEDRENEKLERELAEQVEKRRREERRDAKKTMERQKKQEWRRKMSLGNHKQVQDQPELFKGSKKNIKALADQDKYLDPSALDSDAEDSTASGVEESDSSSDEGLDRLARMEVDVAVDHELRKMRLDDKFRTKQQRKMRKKKETRRQRVMAAWAGEAGAFAEAIQGKAAEQRALRDRDSDAEEEDDDDEADSDDDLKTLRALQSGGAAAGGGGGLDGEALEALVDGAGAPPEARAALRANEAEAAGKRRKRAAADDDEEDGGEEGGEEGGAESSTALVPLAEGGEEDLRAEHRMARWFSGDIFKGVQEAKIRPVDQASDSDQDGEGGSDAEGGGKMRELDDSKLPKMPLTDKERRKLKRRRDKERDERSGKRAKADEDAGPMEVAPLEAPRPLVGSWRPQKPTDPQELAETLALGTLLTQSKKSRMDLIDAAYNRWTFDADEGLPDWFTEDENKNNKPELPVSKELMAQYRAKLREINARPIRKVAEARARKKRRLQKRLEKLRSTAMSLADTPDMSELAKAKQMRKAVSKMAKQDQRRVSVVAMKKGGGGKRMDKGKVPKGAKVKVVDRRMKSDRRGEKKAKARNKSKQKALARKMSLKKQNKKAGGRGGGRGGGGKSGKKGGA